MDDTGMICHKPFNYKGLGNGRYWTRTNDLLRVEQALYPSELTAPKDVDSYYGQGK